MSSIHAELTFKASPKQIYEALTDAMQFSKVTHKPAEIAREPGGAFTCFGGMITGRHVELVPNERIVQAWRAGNWAPGAYSIVRFDLRAQGAETKLVFDHEGFPEAEKEHLVKGWPENYWEPLKKFVGA